MWAYHNRDGESLERKPRKIKQWKMESKDYLINLERRESAQKQFEEFNDIMNTIDYKIWYYEEAIKAETEDVHKKDKIIINK